jgi:hypothetical protein
MTTHTKGPWILRGQIVRPSPQASGICKVYIGKTVDELNEQRANATLIAAAPELLEALLLMREEFVNEPGRCEFTKRESEALELMDKAIAKAKGALNDREY